MTEYFVLWTIELSAESPVEAAKLAREIQLDKESIATCFSVTSENGETEHVDLGELS